MGEILYKPKFIVLVRNPVDQLYSLYNMRKRHGLTNNSFEEEIKDIFTKGLYDSEALIVQRTIIDVKVERWINLFPEKDRTLFIRSADFRDRTQETFDQVCDFLRIPKKKIQIFPKEKNYEEMNPETREKLEEIYKGHNENLTRLLGSNFKW
jgi:hypothetical protein